MHIRALPLLLDGLLRGAVLYGFLLILGFVGLAAQMGLGSYAFLVLGVLVPVLSAAAYISAYFYRIQTPRRWSASWWSFYNVALASTAVLYFLSGMVIYGRAYLWYEVLAGTLFIALMMVVVEALYAMLSDTSFSFRATALGVSCLLLIVMVRLVM